MPTSKIRYIKPESVLIGDTIRVTTKTRDLQQSTVGTVRERMRLNGGTGYYTGEGMEIFWAHPAHKAPRIALLNRNIYQTALEGMEA